MHACTVHVHLYAESANIQWRRLHIDRARLNGSRTINIACYITYNIRAVRARTARSAYTRYTSREKWSQEKNLPTGSTAAARAAAVLRTCARVSRTCNTPEVTLLSQRLAPYL